MARSDDGSFELTVDWSDFESKDSPPRLSMRRPAWSVSDQIREYRFHTTGQELKAEFPPPRRLLSLFSHRPGKAEPTENGYRFRFAHEKTHAYGSEWTHYDFTADLQANILQMRVSTESRSE